MHKVHLSRTVTYRIRVPPVPPISIPTAGPTPCFPIRSIPPSPTMHEVHLSRISPATSARPYSTLPTLPLCPLTLYPFHPTLSGVPLLCPIGPPNPTPTPSAFLTRPVPLVLSHPTIRSIPMLGSYPPLFQCIRHPSDVHPTPIHFIQYPSAFRTTCGYLWISSYSSHIRRIRPVHVHSTSLPPSDPPFPCFPVPPFPRSSACPTSRALELNPTLLHPSPPFRSASDFVQAVPSAPLLLLVLTAVVSRLPPSVGPPSEDPHSDVLSELIELVSDYIPKLGACTQVSGAAYELKPSPSDSALPLSTVLTRTSPATSARLHSTPPTLPLFPLTLYPYHPTLSEALLLRPIGPPNPTPTPSTISAFPTHLVPSISLMSLHPTISPPNRLTSPLLD
ncbi:uncharacterized protein EDB91DRAFT_1250590 [Suillus paluster]|uniref:uncharacterized protein n=1 Tax=Suillus paluster TaxID=48578 RepID=UPI001B87E696|nr:uncharacterized protein EDB91DRAFT_1250590 [Suillus paluster]KAG1735069.1 hypothetical protein EDB91DRAFT_1250590 [Suillus paluster]